MNTIPQKSLLRIFTESITFKGLVVGFMILILLIPQAMISELIRDRQIRSLETIDKINSKWSYAQTVCGPVLSIPYTSTEVEIIDKKENVIKTDHILNITPEDLKINAVLFPEERHYGIYKTMLYRSTMDISGKFGGIVLPNNLNNRNTEIHWDEAYITLGVSDLRGITNDMQININGRNYNAKAGSSDRTFGKKLQVDISEIANLKNGEIIEFNTKLELNGSGNINFIPIGKSTAVRVSGEWTTPSFIGSFTPEYEIIEEGNGKGFQANWSVLHFNRDIPENWTDPNVPSFSDSSFGVDLIQTVDHYQQNMRSVKYAFMFIALTFCALFFFELLTRKRIYPVQYLLVGVALILFYSLLLSLSEQMNFVYAYLIASISTIALISGYVHSIFKNLKQTGILTVLLCLLYIFLYVVLQLEDIALLVGSIALFIILGIIMYLSRKIKWAE